MGSQEADSATESSMQEMYYRLLWRVIPMEEKGRKQDCAEGEAGLAGNLDKTSADSLGTSDLGLIYRVVQSWEQGPGICIFTLVIGCRLTLIN